MTVAINEEATQITVILGDGDVLKQVSRRYTEDESGRRELAYCLDMQQTTSTSRVGQEIPDDPVLIGPVIGVGFRRASDIRRLADNLDDLADAIEEDEDD